jgi:predicted subunit of tRNA(5-methylaminomethyl-2-thiouridylate) methyltransferase
MKPKLIFKIKPELSQKIAKTRAEINFRGLNAKAENRPEMNFRAHSQSHLNFFLTFRLKALAWFNRG